MDNPPDRYAIFSEGGGVSGQFENWIVTPDGQVFKMYAYSDSTEYIGRMDEQNAMQIMQNLSVLSDNPERESKPGNLYKRIQYYEENESRDWAFSATSTKKNDLNIIFNNFKNFISDL